jgi:hypothetical protein
MLIDFLQINREKPQVARGGSFTAFIMFLIMGLILNYLSSDMIKKGEESLKWPKTTGIVIESELARSQDDKGSEMYSPRVNVKYNVNGNEYQTSRINISPQYSTSNSSSVRNIIAKYSKGKNVDVYYNDIVPTEAVLEPGVSTLAKILHYSAYILFILALIMLGKFVIIVGIIGVFIINFFSRKKVKKSNPNSEKTIDKTPENQASNNNEIFNQDRKINFKDDGFSQ